LTIIKKKYLLIVKIVLKLKLVHKYLHNLEFTRCVIVEYQFNESDYLEILDSSTEGSFIQDIEKEEIYFSEKWKRRLGIDKMSPKEAACAIPTLVHPDDLESMNMAYFLAVEKKSPKVQMEFRTRVMDQGYIWILGQGKIIYNQCGEPIKYFGTHIDITNRKQIEESHIKKEERYQSILYSMDDMFCVMEVVFDMDNKPIDFKLIEMNPAFEKQLGANYSSFLGESIELLNSTYSDSCHDMLVKVALTVSAESPAAALCWFTRLTTCCS
jgi:PAS domain S-box-containing protein